MHCCALLRRAAAQDLPHCRGVCGLAVYGNRRRHHPHPRRRQVLLKSVNVGVIAAIFTWGAAPRPGNLGILDYVRAPAHTHHAVPAPCLPHVLRLCVCSGWMAHRATADSVVAAWHVVATPRPNPSPHARAQGGGVRTLGLCPPSPNCISTAEELNDIGHYAPPL